MARILIVDDDTDVLGTLERVLIREGFDIVPVSSGQKALDYLQTHRPDVVVLDIIMPGINGIEVCRRIRQDPRLITLPVLFLTAKGSTDDIVEGFDVGGDDYVVKPFEPSELCARIHALLRREMRGQDRAAIIQIDNLILDSTTYQARVCGEVVQLTSTEYRLLRYLMDYVDQTLSLSHLLQAVWDYPEGTGDADLVRAHVRNLRLKIERDPDRRYIQTVHGLGYMISKENIEGHSENS